MIAHQSLREQVRELLLRRIGCGEFERGHRLVGAKLAEELGISTVPVHSVNLVRHLERRREPVGWAGPVLQPECG